MRSLQLRSRAVAPGVLVVSLRNEVGHRRWSSVLESAMRQALTQVHLASTAAPVPPRSESPAVVAALYSSDAVETATSAIGRRAVRLANAGELIGSVDREGSRAVLFELGHPAFGELCTRLSAVGAHVPLVIVLPPGRLPARELLALGCLASVFVAHDARKLPDELRRAMANAVVPSDAHVVARAMADQLQGDAAALGMALYVTGTRNVSVRRATQRLGNGALRNRLRALGLARASTILGWACAVSLTWRLENEDFSLAEASRAAGFGTTRQCSDRILYPTGRTPTTLRDQCGFTGLVDEFMTVVRTRIVSGV